MSNSLDPRLRTISIANDQVNEERQSRPHPEYPQSRPTSTSIAPQSHNGPILSPYPPLHDANSARFAQPFYTLGNQSNEDSMQDAAIRGDSGDAKRSRACEACRGLKVKCEPDLTGNGPCRRCAKANRTCQITQPSRKRQKKTDTRVADLEKKIEILQRLTANINPKAAETPNTYESRSLPTLYTSQPESSHISRQQASNPPQQAPPSDSWPPYHRETTSEGQRNASMVKETSLSGAPAPRKSSTSDVLASSMANQANEARALLAEVDSAWQTDGGRPKLQPQIYTDVIDRGMLSLSVAEQIFSCYVDEMAPHFPAVIFPDATTVFSLRKEKPILFLAILAAGCGPKFPEARDGLVQEILETFASRIVVRGEKSLEIVQALLVTVLWYHPPEHFEELKFYQLAHMAAVMAIDIGLGKRSRTQALKGSSGFFNTVKVHPSLDPNSLEARRTWLACYFICCNTAMGLRRPNLIRWSDFMADSLKVLEFSPEAVSSDKSLCAWIRSQHINEEVGYQFSMDDPYAQVSIAEDKTNYALKKFENDLAVWRREVPIEARSNSLEMTGHVVSLYMHEIAMHVDHNVDEFRPPYHESTLAGLMSDAKPQALTTSHVEALSACLTAIDGIFEVFLKYSIDVIRCLPVTNFVRVAYATVVLIKMSLAASNPENGIGQIFVASNLKAEEYLEGLIQLFTGASADDKSRISAKFLTVLRMLKIWFQRRLQNTKRTAGAQNESSTGNAANVAPEAAAPVQQTSKSSQNGDLSKPKYIPSNTPLDVLSDVATSNSRNQPASLNHYQTQNGWQQPQLSAQFQSYPVNIMNQQGFDDAMSNVDASINDAMSADFLANGGFDQAVESTLAGFGAYLDDGFFANPGYEFIGL